MENDIIETVLTEILKELKLANDLGKENNELAIESKNRLVIIEKKIENKETIKQQTSGALNK